jgi:hypothetical protein
MKAERSLYWMSVENVFDERPEATAVVITDYWHSD